MRAKAVSKLAHVGDDIRDIDYEIHILSREIELLAEKKEDAKWAGDTDKVNRVTYPLMLIRTMRAVLTKRRNVIMREMNHGG
jgi:Ni,Fe-hydrogenase III large subunit